MAFALKRPPEEKEITLEGIVDIAKSSDAARMKETIRKVSEILTEERSRSSGLRIRGNLHCIPLRGDAVVHSDLHGDEESLVELLRKTNFVERVKRGESLMQVSLGDSIDRGQHPIEVLNINLELKRYFPENVVMLRGNHEELFISPNAGAVSDFVYVLMRRYGDEAEGIYRGLHSLFSKMPLAAKSENRVLFLHGGVWDGMDEAGLVNGTNSEQVLWGDPREGIAGMERNRDRGIGFYFGENVLVEALKNVQCDFLIRGHEPVSEENAVMFNGRLATVFSTGIHRNYGFVSLQNEIEDLRSVLQRF